MSGGNEEEQKTQGEKTWAGILKPLGKQSLEASLHHQPSLGTMP